MNSSPAAAHRRRAPAAASRAVGLLALLVGLAACGARSIDRSGADERATRAELSRLGAPCAVAGLDREARCLDLPVPEDPNQPAGRQITLRVRLVPPTSAQPSTSAPPLLMLPGGPGGSAGRLAPMVAGPLAAAAADRWVVLADPRGTGESSPIACPLPRRSGALDLSALRAALGACAEAFPGDVRRYSMVEIVGDIERIRQALGAPRVDLWGVSYGTRTALRYAARHPNRVRAMVLDGALPPTAPQPLTVPRDAQLAIEGVFAMCAADAACAAAYPTLAADLQAVVDRLRAGPVEVEILDEDGQTRLPLSLSRGRFGAVLRGALYSPSSAADVPWVVHFAARGDFGPFGVLMREVFGGGGGPGRGWGFAARLAVLCADDYARVDAAAAEAAAEGTFSGIGEWSFWSGHCAHWPHRARVPADSQPVAVGTPALVLSGGRDPVTPPRLGEETVAHLPQGQHLVAAEAGHTVTPFGCAGALIAGFLADPDAPVDGACLASGRRPPFLVGRGSQPRP